MHQLEKIVGQLDQHLTESQFYSDTNYTRREELSAIILDEWKDRFKEAVLFDFRECCQLNVLCTDIFFELFGDQGATVWSLRIVVDDETADPKLSFWIRSIINYRLSKVFLEEPSIKQRGYNGSNLEAKALFKKLKGAVSDGYESTILFVKLLSK